MTISFVMTYLVAAIGAQISGTDPPNLPHKVFLPENSETGQVVYKINDIIDSENPRNKLQEYEFYPADTRNIFKYNITTKEVSVINGSLLKSEGLHKSYLILFREIYNHSKVYPLVIEILDVTEATDFKQGMSIYNGCCDDVRRLFWIVPVSSALEFILLILGFIILLTCVLQKGKQKMITPLEK
ncbi:uncharacterized protein LOC134249187 [Saccostrea cucullata]|uniref:uncharacterized protein LOC134249187 n=1 Tax=Saccostrea cuccullata TaxID=36930 RepID=UPI002ED05ADF